MDADDARDLQRYQKEKKKAEAKNKLREVAEFCNCIGEIYSKYGQYEEAIQEHTQELHLSEALADKIGEAVACRKIGECHCFLGQYEEALRLQKRHLVLARECGNSLEEQRAWATIGKTYFCQSDTKNIMTSATASKKAEKAYTKGLEACEKVKSSVKVEEYMAMKGRLYLNIGLVYDTRDEIKLCTDVMKRAVAIAEKFKLHNELYMCHASLANVYHKCGESIQALRSVDLALRMAEKLRNKPDEKEMYIQKAQIQVSMGDYLSAKHCLKKAHKLKMLSDTDQDKLPKLFCCVNKMQEAALELETQSDGHKVAELHETLADCSAELGNFSDAVQHYFTTLQSKDLLNSERRADIYVSLAQTYADLRKYDEAIHYYRQELEERTDSEQSCRTLLNIAELEELRGSKYPSLCKIYMSAFEYARKAKHIKLQTQTLKSLIAIQKYFKQDEHLRETEKKLDSLAKKYGLSDSQLSNSEEEEGNSSDEDETGATSRQRGKRDVGHDGNISLSDLTLSEESDVTEDIVAAPSRPKKTNLARRNEKGETPLHRACIEGNLRKAKALLAQGHPVNPRDFCGWLPLHEACNHGHLEVVRSLLDAGAWINDRGGERCGGVTPLIDAANCGNLAIVRLLVEFGASLQAKDDDGNTAHDCLQAWYQRAGDTLGASDIIEYQTIEKLLQTRGGGKPSSSSTSTSIDIGSSSGHSFKERLSVLREKKKNRKENPPSSRGRKSKGQSGDRAFSSDGSSDDEILPLPYKLPPLTEKQNSGATQYRSVIDQIGSSVQKRLESELSHEKNKRSKSPCEGLEELPALLNDGDDVGDDWLINDVPAVRSRKKGKQVDNLFTTSSSRSTARKRPMVGVGDAVEKSLVSDKRKRFTREEDVPHISSSGDAADKQIPGRFVSLLRCGGNSVSIPEVFEDHSGSEACPVTSSTERVTSTLPAQNTTATSHDLSLDAWDSDEDLLSHVNLLEDSLGEDSLVQSQGNRSGTSRLHSSVADTLRDFGGIAPSANRKPAQESSNIKHTSKSSYTLDSLLSDRNIKDNSNSSSCVGNSNNHRASGQTIMNRVNEPQLVSQPVQVQHTSPLHISHQPVVQQKQQPCTLPINQGVMKIKVKVGDHTLLIPIPSADQQRPVLWLCQQAGERYFNTFLVRPLLTLSSSDGSVLNPSDTIAHVLTPDEILTAVVRSWQRPRLEERYTQACRLCLLEEPSKQVIAALQACEHSSNLNLGDQSLTVPLLQPVFQALEGYSTLAQLILSGNRLGDSGMDSLIGLLASLPILKVLSLDSTGLSVEGVRTFATALKHKALSPESGDLLLGSLVDLSMGHNSLEDLAGSALATVISHLPRLSRIDVPACGFTQGVFRQDFCSALKGAKLKHVSVAENQLDQQGISILFDCLHSDCLQGIDISHSRSGTEESLLPVLESFTSSGSCLKNLTLAGCHLTESDVIAVNRLTASVKSLSTLSLSQNRSVTNKTLQKLLALSAGNGSCLTSLTARGCSLTAPISADLLEALASKMQSETPLVKFVFSCRGLKQTDAESVKTIWMTRWKERAVCKILGIAVSLTVSEDR